MLALVPKCRHHSSGCMWRGRVSLFMLFSSRQADLMLCMVGGMVVDSFHEEWECLETGTLAVIDPCASFSLSNVANEHAIPSLQHEFASLENAVIAGMMCIIGIYLRLSKLFLVSCIPSSTKRHARQARRALQ